MIVELRALRTNADELTLLYGYAMDLDPGKLHLSVLDVNLSTAGDPYQIGYIASGYCDGHGNAGLGADFGTAESARLNYNSASSLYEPL